MTLQHKHYWSFYWPLALTGLAMILAAQFKNGILSRYPEAISELAIFAIASSIFRLCNAGIIFVPQMANVLSRSPHASRVCISFICLAAFCLSIPMLLCGFTSIGTALIPQLFKMPNDWMGKVVLYLQLLSPMILINAVRQYYTGLLVQSKRTGWVTILNCIMLSTTILVLFIGLGMGKDPVWVISLSHLIPASLHLCLSYVIYKRYHVQLYEKSADDLNYRSALLFFYPIAFTSSMFAMSRPVIYGFISHTANAAVTIAVLRVVFDFTMIFYNALNQFRHMFVTFGKEDYIGVRNFMLKVFAVILWTMILITVTPIHAWCLHYLLGIDNAAHIAMAQEAMFVLCAIPVFLILRNYYHGIALLEHKTGRMGLSGVLRISSITVFVAAAYYFDSLNHITGAAALVVGFMAESLSMWWFSRDTGKSRCNQVALE